MSDPNPPSPSPAAATPVPPEKPAAPPAAQPALIDIEQFASVELRAGRVVKAEPHPNAERLLVMQVDVGEAQPRQIVAGIRADWSPEQIVGKTLVICCNLKPAKLRGLESQGMMLAVKGSARVWPLTVEGETLPGTRVT